MEVFIFIFVALYILLEEKYHTYFLKNKIAKHNAQNTDPPQINMKDQWVFDPLTDGLNEEGGKEQLWAFRDQGRYIE